MTRHTKIVATLGPASSDEASLGALLDAGVDIVRLNLSHGDQVSLRSTIEQVRWLAERRGRPWPVMIDLMGPRFRLGQLASPLQLTAGSQVIIGSELGAQLPLEDTALLPYLRPGERLLIDNGLVEIEISECDLTRAVGRVVHGGPVATRKILNFPDTELPFRLTEKDLSDLRFAVGEGYADLVVVSFVGSPEHMAIARRAIEELGVPCPPLIAKLERAVAIKNLEAIVEASDGVLASTGSLFVELPVHEAPMHLRRIVDCGHRLGKQVMLATQMLESMAQNPRPTSADAVGVANAVLSGADALVLSAETAVGNFPAEAVRTMDRLIRESESYRAATAGTAEAAGDRVRIQRSIEFPPEYRQSGIAILSYFSKVVESKYGDLDVGVAITQQGDRVTLTIETPEGTQEIIERTLGEYGMVVLGELAPEKLLDSTTAALELRQELRLAQVRIEGLRDIGLLQQGNIEKLHELLALSIQSGGSTTIIEPKAVAVATASATAHLQQLNLLRGTLQEAVDTLPASAGERAELEAVRDGLEETGREPTPEGVAGSSAMSRLRRFLEGLADDDSATAKTLEGVRRGVEIAQDLARAYNAVA